jgi:hypothetical protein
MIRFWSQFQQKEGTKREKKNNKSPWMYSLNASDNLKPQLYLTAKLCRWKFQEWNSNKGFQDESEYSTAICICFQLYPKWIGQLRRKKKGLILYQNSRKRKVEYHHIHSPSYVQSNIVDVQRIFQRKVDVNLWNAHDTAQSTPPYQTRNNWSTCFDVSGDKSASRLRHLQQ